MTSVTCCARSAAINRASVDGAIADAPGSSTSSLIRLPMSVPPGSLVNTAPRWAASRAACVDLPDASPPSKTMSRPRLLNADLVPPQRPFGQQAGADDDHAAQPQGDAHARQLNREGADRHRPRAELVDGGRQQQPHREGDDQQETAD